MSETTDFAGLTRLSPGEPMDERFLGDNLDIIDRLLRVGAVTHRHDGHAALADPPDDMPLVVEIDTTGGTIPADLGLYFGYTWIDADGGETLMSDAVAASTEPGLVAPTGSPDAEVDHVAGGLLANTYTYAVTIGDGMGGETTLSGTVQVTIPPGFANSQVTISGLTALVDEAGGAEWRLYRSRGAGNFTYLTSGTADEIVDDDTLCPNCDQRPPAIGTTSNTNRVRVTLPADWPTGVAALRLYVSEDGSFTGASLVGDYLPADAGTELIFTSIAVEAGAPPPVSLSIPGANPIDPDTELLDWHWKRPVANAAALPVDAEEGDVRITLDDGLPHRFIGGAWDVWAMGGGGGGGGATSLPIDEVGGSAANVPIWTKDGVDVAWLRGHQSEDTLTLTNEGFAGGAGALGDDYARNGSGSAVPQAGGNNTNAIHYVPYSPTWASFYDGHIERTFTVASLNWTRIGVTLGTGRTGLFAWITPAGDLVIATRTVDSNLEADFTALVTEPLPAAPAISDVYNIQLDRTGNHLNATVHQGKVVIAEADADIPAPLRADFGQGVSLEAGMADRWSNPDAWTTDVFKAFYRRITRELYVEALGDDNMTRSRRLFDGLNEDYVNFGSQGFGVYQSADWGDDPGAPASYLRNADHEVTLSGRMTKTAGTAPAAAESVVSLDEAAWPVNGEILAPVATGDSDGVELGIIRITTTGDITWEAGRSTDPATKAPYVSLDGISYQVA